METAAASTLPAAPFIFSVYWQSFNFIFCPSFQFKNIISSQYVVSQTRSFLVYRKSTRSLGRAFIFLKQFYYHGLADLFFII